MLDIHQISTGRGNAAFVVFPDGVTMLVDAGAVPFRPGPQLAPARPSDSRHPGEWIARYIERYRPSEQTALDYALVTHYHDDHMGAIEEVGRRIRFKQMLDRGDDPAPMPGPLWTAYAAFRASLGARAQTVRAGQVLRRAGALNLEVRAVAANGEIWTGQGDDARLAFPADWKELPAAERPGENHFSIALRIRYGQFDYFTGGDLVGVVLDSLPAWHDLETPVARVVGPVDVAVLNHHGWLDSTNPFLLATLQPRVFVLPAWHATHPDHGVVRRLISPRSYPGPRDLFATALLDAPRTVLSYLPQSPFTAAGGHVVVRVSPGGADYAVLMLDVTGESGRVLSRHGPYRSH